MKNFLAAIVVLLSLTIVAHAQVQSHTGNDAWLKQALESELMSSEELYRLSPGIAEKRKQDEAEKTFKYVAIIVGILVVVGAGIFFFRPAFRSFGKSADLTRMIQKYSGDCMNPQVVDFAAVYILLISSCNVGGRVKAQANFARAKQFGYGG